MSATSNAHPAGRARTYYHDEFPIPWLLHHKGPLSVGVCIPARNEASSIAPIVSAIRSELMERAGLVDRLVVVDDHSEDATAAVAAGAGAEVIAATGNASAPGKGRAMRRGLDELGTDLAVFCDADIVGFHPRLVSGLVGPLLADPRLVMVKATYLRPHHGGEPGGRVTELCAKPLLRALLPQLSWLEQPLAGETALRSEAVSQLAFPPGYGIEVGLLIEVARAFGEDSIAQCDLGVRRHRNRSLPELALQADEIVATVLGLCGSGLPATPSLPAPGEIPLAGESLA